jgi:hypothetical protein
MESETGFVQIGAIPIELREEIASHLRKYSVNLIGLRGEDEFRFCGSGTLVRVDDEPFIITAAHCAEALRGCQALGLVICEFRHRAMIPVVPDPIIVEARVEDTWGPDLAFIPLPASQVGAISARMSFCNLSRAQAAALSGDLDAERGLWAIVGAPAETSNLTQPSDLEFAQTVLWMGVDRTHKRNAWDYIDLGIPVDAPGRLRTYGGMSGGGIWRIDICRSKEGEWGWLSPPCLEGVVYYETAAENGLVFLRGHGRQSVYRHGIAAIVGNRG